MIEPGDGEVERVDLAQALRTLRRASGLSGERLADKAGMSQSKISKIETGRLTPSLADVERIVHALKVDRGYADELLQLARVGATDYQSHRESKRRGWHKVQREIAAIERSAAEARHLLPMMITGLMQTPDYAYQSVGTDLPEATRREIVAHKLDRQRVLYDNSKRFVFLYTEAALRWRLVDPPAMAIQMDKIFSVAGLSSVSMEVIPLSRTVPDCPLEVFTIYDHRLVDIETSAAGIALRDPQDVAYYRKMFDLLSSHALRGEEARDFIRGIAEEFRNEC